MVHLIKFFTPRRWQSKVRTKPIYGVEAYFIEDIAEWRKTYDEYRADKKKLELSNERTGTNIEAEGASKSKGNPLNRSRHLVLLAMNQEGLNNIYKMVSESYNGDYFYRKPRMIMHYLTNILAALFAFPLVLAVYMLVILGSP